MTPLTAGRERVLVLSLHPLQEYKEGVSVEAFLVLPLQAVTLTSWTSLSSSSKLSCSFWVLAFLSSYFLFSAYVLILPSRGQCGLSLFISSPSRFSQLLTQCQGDGRWLSLFCQNTRGLSKATTKHITSIETAWCTLSPHAEHTSSPELALLWALNSQLMFSVSSVSTQALWGQRPCISHSPWHRPLEWMHFKDLEFELKIWTDAKIY